MFPETTVTQVPTSPKYEGLTWVLFEFEPPENRINPRITAAVSDVIIGIGSFSGDFNTASGKLDIVTTSGSLNFGKSILDNNLLF